MSETFFDTQEEQKSGVRQTFNTVSPAVRPGASKFFELELVPIEEDRPEREIRNDRQLWAATSPNSKPFTFNNR